MRVAAGLYRSAGPAAPSPQTLQRHERSALWFELYRRGGRVTGPVLIHDWSPPMDGIEATV